MCLLPAGDLQQGGPTPIGAQKANLSPEAKQYLQEVALNEQVGSTDQGTWCMPRFSLPSQPEQTCPSCHL